MKVTIDHLEAGTGGVTKGDIVKLSSSTWVTCSAKTDDAKGVALETKDAGQLVAVCIQGECEVRAAGTLTLGGDIITDANGRAIDDDTTVGAVLLAVAMETGVAASGSDYPLVKVAVAACTTAN